MSRRSRAASVIVAAVTTVGLIGCGVEVPDDVAARATPSTAPTTAPAPSSTAPPTSDDDLEQALIGYGYSVAEAECGAANLRETLDEADIEALIEAESIEDIPPRAALDFADALRPCVEDGPGGPGEPQDPDDPSDPVPPTTEQPTPEPPDGGMPDLPDAGEGDVTRSRFLAALLAAGFGVPEARCVVDGLYDAFDQETINEIFRSAGPEDVDPDVADQVQEILDGCGR